MLDKTVSPHSYSCSWRLIWLIFLSPDVGAGGSALQPALGFSGRARQVVAGHLCIIVFLPFTRLEARPAPELIGLWSRVNSRAPTARQLPSGQSRRAHCRKVFQVKDHPRKSCFHTTGHPLWGGRLCPAGTSAEGVSVLRNDLFMFFFPHACVVEVRSLWNKTFHGVKAATKASSTGF